MTGYVVRRDSPERLVIENNRVYRHYPSSFYLEWLPYHRTFEWLASSQQHAAVFSREAALAIADEMRQHETVCGVSIHEDYYRREPQFVELPERTVVEQQAESAQRNPVYARR